jgi:hypothetical protein
MYVTVRITSSTDNENQKEVNARKEKRVENQPQLTED